MHPSELTYKTHVLIFSCLISNDYTFVEKKNKRQIRLVQQRTRTPSACQTHAFEVNLPRPSTNIFSQTPNSQMATHLKRYKEISNANN